MNLTAELLWSNATSSTANDIDLGLEALFTIPASAALLTWFGGYALASSVAHDVSIGGFWLLPILFGTLGLPLRLAVANSHIGCDSPAAYGYSISYLCANLFFEGYVYMFCSLTACALIVIYRTQALQRRRRALEPKKDGYDVSTAAFGEHFLHAGIAVAAITGVIPWHADHCWLDRPDVPNTFLSQILWYILRSENHGCWQLTLKLVHGNGIIPGMMLTVGGMYMRIGARLTTISTSPTLMLLGLIYIGTTVFSGYCLVQFVLALLGSGRDAPAAFMCPTFDSETQCNGAELPELWHHIAAGYVAEGGYPNNYTLGVFEQLGLFFSMNETEGAPEPWDGDYSTVKWPCVWTAEPSSLEVPACRTTQCDLDVLLANQTSVIFEYHWLLFWLVTISLGFYLCEAAIELEEDLDVAAIDPNIINRPQSRGSAMRFLYSQAVFPSMGEKRRQKLLL